MHSARSWPSQCYYSLSSVMLRERQSSRSQGVPCPYSTLYRKVVRSPRTCIWLSTAMCVSHAHVPHSIEAWNKFFGIVSLLRLSCANTYRDWYEPPLKGTSLATSVSRYGMYLPRPCSSTIITIKGEPLTIVPFQHFAYVPALDSSLSMRLELAFWPRGSVAPHDPRSISLYLRCSRRVFPVVASLQASLWIVSCAMLPMLWPF